MRTIYAGWNAGRVIDVARNLCFVVGEEDARRVLELARRNPDDLPGDLYDRVEARLKEMQSLEFEMGDSK